jgi:cell wall-associated NlpC family hydrolase
VFARHGVALPRAVRDQFAVGQRVETRNLLPGDLLFFATEGSYASHVGIAIDEDAFVHAPSSRGVVRVERLSGRYWAERLMGARRVAQLADDNSHRSTR